MKKLDAALSATGAKPPQGGADEGNSGMGWLRFAMGMCDHKRPYEGIKNCIQKGIDELNAATPNQGSADGWVRTSEALPDDDSDVFAAIWWKNADNPAYSHYDIHDCAYYQGGKLPDGSQQKIFTDCEGNEFEAEDVAYWIYKRKLAASFPSPPVTDAVKQEREG